MVKHKQTIKEQGLAPLSFSPFLFYCLHILMSFLHYSSRQKYFFCARLSWLMSSVQ